MQLKPLHPLFAAEAEGVDLSRPLDDAAVSGIRAAVDRYGVLVFRRQSLSEDAQVAFARQFGPLEAGLKRALNWPGRFKHVETVDVSNVDEAGEIADIGSKKIYSQLANQLWHSDSQSKAPPGRYSMLQSVVVPPEGGDTEFADLRAAYDELSGDLKAKIEDLRAAHHVLRSRMDLGDTEWTEEQKRAVPPVERPLVHVHAGSGRKSLLVGVHATHVVGMHVGQGKLLLAELLEHSTQREFVYRHRWRTGDFLIWDNRCVIHRGRRYDFAQRRELRRVTTKDIGL